MMLLQPPCVMLCHHLLHLYTNTTHTTNQAPASGRVTCTQVRRCVCCVCRSSKCRAEVEIRILCSCTCVDFSGICTGVFIFLMTIYFYTLCVLSTSYFIKTCLLLSRIKHTKKTSYLLWLSLEGSWLMFTRLGSLQVVQ